ncbi:MAG: hypothetical protein GY915_04465 [bacterium]|nr:hypothetical protein [bacterium]
MKKFLITAAVCGVSFICVESQARVVSNEEERDLIERLSAVRDLEHILGRFSAGNTLEAVTTKAKKPKSMTPLQRFDKESKMRQLAGYNPLFLGDTVSGSMRGAMNSYKKGSKKDASDQFAQSGRQYLGWARMVSEDKENIETGTQLWDLYLSAGVAYRWAAHNAPTDALRNRYIFRAIWALNQASLVSDEESVTSKISSEQEKLLSLVNSGQSAGQNGQSLQERLFTEEMTPLQRFARLAEFTETQGYNRPFLGDVVSGSMRTAMTSYHEGSTEESANQFAQSGREYLNWAQMVSEDEEGIETGTQLWDLYLSGAQAYRWAAHNAPTAALRSEYITRARWALDQTLEISDEESVTSKVDSEREKLSLLEG